MKVFHHNDMDGRCAGFIVRHYMQTFYPMTGIEYIEIDYDRKFPFDQVDKAEPVFILDFSLEVKDMEKLLQITEDVYWIDHHGSSIRKFEEHWAGNEIKGLRDERKAGCVLTYIYCSEFFEGKKKRYVPMFIQLIGDRDIWAWKYGERSRLFHRGLLAEDTSPGSPVWYEIWDSTKRFEKNGIAIERVLAEQAREVFNRGGFWTEFLGHKCFVVNSTLQSSEYFEQFIPGADMWISFRYTGDCWSISLYSTKFDVSKIAEKFVWNGRQGGGQKGAAGFTCYYPPFLSSARDVSKARLQREVDAL